MDGTGSGRRRYQHTQIGWLVIGISGFAAALMTAIVVLADSSLSVALLPVFLIAPLLFGTLTVTVTDDEVVARFGVGLIRKRFAVKSIHGCARVRNRWYHGWGLRMISGGWLYNVSGFDAVELTLAEGRRARIGTDDPDRLLDLLHQVVGYPIGATSGEQTRPRRIHPAAAGVVAILVPVLLLVGLMFYVSMRPVTVTLSPQGFVVHGGTYSDEVRAADIVGVSLEPTLPTIQLRTNGFAFGDTLRGSFRLRDKSSARLFVERGNPPFVAVRTSRTFVMINFKDPARTEELYSTIQRLRDPR